jgi:hypothetical protein
MSGEVLDMYVRLQLINTATDGEHSASLSEYPDLLAPAIVESQPAHATAHLQLQPERSATGGIPSAVVIPPVERPRTATAAPVVARSEEEAHLAEQYAMGVDALARANREAL